MSQRRMATPTLLGLPAELQNRIYHMVLVHDDVIKPQLREDRKIEHIALALVQTCREIRSVTTRIYYGMNCFLFFDRTGDLDYWLESFFTTLGAANLKLCRHIWIESSVEWRNPQFQPAARHCPAGYCVMISKFDFEAETNDADGFCPYCARERSRASADWAETIGEILYSLRYLRPRTRNFPRVLAKELSYWLNMRVPAVRR